MDRRSFISAAAATPLAALPVIAKPDVNAKLLVEPTAVQMQNLFNQIVSLAEQSVPKGFNLSNVFTVPSRVRQDWEICVVVEDDGEGLEKRTGYMYPSRSDAWCISTKREFNKKYGLTN